MDSRNIQSIRPSPSRRVKIPEIILHIAQFLDGKDELNMSLAFFGVPGFGSSIFWKKIQKTKKSISISQCYYLSPDSWMRELNYNSEQARNLTSFDASHCFWLLAEVLQQTVSKMPNLEQLLIHDTKISLAHLPQMFKSCQKLNKLSFTLVKKHSYKFINIKSSEMGLGEESDWLLKGFKRLTHLKLFSYNMTDENRCAYWQLTFRVLGWCSRRCIDLYIEVPCPTAQYRQDDPFVFDDEEQHSWMTSLKSLVFIARYSLPRDNFVHNFLTRFARYRQPNSLERLWIEPLSKAAVNTLDWYNDDVPLTKSLLLWPADRADFTHGDYDGLRQLEHVAYVPFSRLANYPGLKYIRGYCTDAEGLNEFCAEHPMLEHLHFSTAHEFDQFEDDTAITVGNWRLPHLKTVVYRCSFPVKEIIDHLIEACPNIEAFHVGNIDDLAAYNSSLPIAKVSFLSAISFTELTSLSFNGFQLFDGSYMAPILQKCPKLQSLHLSGTALPGAFLHQLGECLAKATNLRDLRIQLFNREKVKTVLDFLQKLRGCSNHLKRLVFYAENQRYSTAPIVAAEFRTFLKSFPLQMPRLVFFCLAGISLNSGDTDVVKGYWEERILPNRPGFSHFFGRELPKGIDSDFPRIHMDEIVRPIDWFLAPPHFDDINDH